MKKLNITILSTILISASLFTINPNAQDNTYETYKKPIPKTHTNQESPKEALEDINSLQNIQYLKLKTSLNYEIAISNNDGTYSYVESSENLNDAIDLANKLETQKSNGIPVVINSDGLVVYATEGIGRIVKIVNGLPSSDTNSTTYIYRTSELKSPEHTYINHSFIDDVPMIENNGISSKIEVTGYTGYIKNTNEDGSSNIIVVPINQAKSLSYYNVNGNGELVHHISPDVTSDNASYSSQVLGPAPSFLNQNVKYYSYDGNYFYENIEVLISDAKGNHHNNAVNSTNSYYNYYQYLPARTKTSFTEDEINAYFEANTPSNSVLRGTGDYFIKAQNEYGMNAIMSIGIAMNESARGTSNIALTKNNIFGAAANDAYPQGADKFSSIEECIMRVSNYYFSNGYFNPKSWKYNGSALGNKNFGSNVRYASDPYWSEKAVRNMYHIDKYLANSTGLKDYNRYQIGMYTNPTTIKNTSNKELYKILSSETRRPVQPPQGQVGDTTIVLNTTNNNYQIRPDRVVGINETNYNSDGTYLWDVYGVVESNNVQLINQASDINTDYMYSWAKDFITDAMNKGWVDTTNTFRPDGFIKRSEFVKIVNRAFNLTQKGTESFDDVNPSDWFYDDICIAVKAGYIEGRTPTEFAPHDLITRQEAAKIVGVMLGIENNQDVTTSFNDDIYIANWADGYVNGLVNLGILSGYEEDNTFRPNNNIKRGESVKILSIARK